MVKQLVLALPENRLATLLSQHKFEEAEEFARKFALDPKVLVCYQYGLKALVYGIVTQYNIIPPIYGKETQRIFAESIIFDSRSLGVRLAHCTEDVTTMVEVVPVVIK